MVKPVELVRAPCAVRRAVHWRTWRAVPVGASQPLAPSPARPEGAGQDKPPGQAQTALRPPGGGAPGKRRSGGAGAGHGDRRRRRARGCGVGRRAAANARERDRTHSVNAAFGALRRLIPTRPADRRLSKVETLRLAASYIAHLANVLLLEQAEGTAAAQPCPQPVPPGTTAPRPICTFCLSEQRKRVRDRKVEKHYVSDALLLVVQVVPPLQIAWDIPKPGKHGGGRVSQGLSTFIHQPGHSQTVPVHH
uniref:Uncharacterized protein n=1 Tax=Melopsittacus undulatus TaxID=13146 RepID=A0A8V5G553_MELUD